MSTIPLIEISSAEPRERGRQHGEAARAQIDRSISYYAESFERSSGLSWERVLERVPRWNPLIEAYLPGILEEVEGIAEGANRRVEEILALNGRGELAHANPFADDAEEGCSSFAITEAAGDGHVYCGQNWDWREQTTDTVVMLRIEQPPKPTIVMQTEAGQVGRQGANSAGIGLNANGLGARFGDALGLPQPYIRRKVLDAAGFDDALEAVFESSQSVCTNLLLTHRSGFAIDVETTPARHGWLYPTDGLLVHANHFIAFVPEQIAATYRPFSPDSLYRVPRIERVLRRAPEATTPEELRALVREAMSDHFGHPNSVCNHPDESRHPLDRYVTVASSLVDLSTGDYWLASGPPCEHDFERLPWNLYDGPAGKETLAPEPLAAEAA
jgi:isopenicillin-N N-acyltransferase-like protein